MRRNGDLAISVANEDADIPRTEQQRRQGNTTHGPRMNNTFYYTPLAASEAEPSATTSQWSGDAEPEKDTKIPVKNSGSEEPARAWRWFSSKQASSSSTSSQDEQPRGLTWLRRRMVSL